MISDDTDSNSQFHEQDSPHFLLDHFSSAVQTLRHLNIDIGLGLSANGSSMGTGASASQCVGGYNNGRECGKFSTTFKVVFAILSCEYK